MTTPNRTQSCFLCDEPITPANNSEEHIFPNAIGGRRIVSNFLCVTCNNTTGFTWDAELARQLNQWTIFFGVVGRRNGPPPAIRIKTSAGEKLSLRGDGSLALQHPSIKETKTETGSQFQLTVRDESDLKQILMGIKRRFPRFDIESALRSAPTPSLSYARGAVNLCSDFGGELSGRSVVKTAVAFAKYSGVNPTEFYPAAEYLRNPFGSPCFGYYFEEDLVQNRPPGVPLHCVGVAADPRTGLVLAYIEYFGIQRIVACLSETYTGVAFRGAHAIDPTTGHESQPTVVLPLGPNDLKEIYEYKRIRPNVQQSVFHNVIPPALKRDRDRALQQAVKDALDHAWANCGAQPGERITPSHAKEMSRLFAERIAPFWAHLRSELHLPES